MRLVLCASMTLSQRLLEIQQELSKFGHEVEVPTFAKHYATLPNQEAMHRESAKNKVAHDLIRGYYRKIKASDAILVVNETRHGIDHYIGGNTFLEMGFAHVHNKPIFLLNPLPRMHYTDEILTMQPRVLNGRIEDIC